VRYELPHLAVDLADHDFAKRQQEGHLYKSPLLCCFGGFAVDDHHEGVGSLSEPVGKVSRRISALRAPSPDC
jgi:hypothetical protein